MGSITSFARLNETFFPFTTKFIPQEQDHTVIKMIKASCIVFLPMQSFIMTCVTLAGDGIYNGIKANIKPSHNDTTASRIGKTIWGAAGGLHNTYVCGKILEGVQEGLANKAQELADQTAKNLTIQDTLNDSVLTSLDPVIESAAETFANSSITTETIGNGFDSLVKGAEQLVPSLSLPLQLPQADRLPSEIIDNIKNSVQNSQVKDLMNSLATSAQQLLIEPPPSNSPISPPVVYGNCSLSESPLVKALGNGLSNAANVTGDLFEEAVKGIVQELRSLTSPSTKFSTETEPVVYGNCSLSESPLVKALGNGLSNAANVTGDLFEEAVKGIAQKLLSTQFSRETGSVVYRNDSISASPFAQTLGKGLFNVTNLAENVITEAVKGAAQKLPASTETESSEKNSWVPIAIVTTAAAIAAIRIAVILKRFYQENNKPEKTKQKIDNNKSNQTKQKTQTIKLTKRTNTKKT